MKKTFILDTNVLLHEPRALFSFEDNHVVIPIYVVEEIDNFKKELSELGRNARRVSHYLDELRTEGSLSKGVKLDSGGTLSVAITAKVLPPEVTTDRGQDSKILAVALDLQGQLQGKEKLVFITKDTNLRIRADAIGIETENFEPERTELDELYRGYSTLEMDGDDIDAFYEKNALSLPDPYYAPNEYLILKDKLNPSHTALGRFHLGDKSVMPLAPFPRSGAWGI